ncbi:MAG: 50S ribosomal protein L11 methyltransferase [bacterium]
MENKRYINLTLSVPEELYDLSYGVICDFQTCGIEEKFDELIISVDYDYWTDETESNLLEQLKFIDNSMSLTKKEVVLDKNWNAEFEKNSPLIVINDRLGIAPEWKQKELKTDIKIIINPKMSFGTGDHATTRLMCRLMEHSVKPGSQWIDAGCGSGVLAILAIKLGAKSVLAFDYDLWSVENTQENIMLNDISDEIEIIHDKIENIKLPPVHGIAANMFSNLLISSMEKFYSSLKDNKGVLILSGILKYDKPDVIESAETFGFELVSELCEDEWVALQFRINYL